MPASSSPTCSEAPASTAWRRNPGPGGDETNETIDDIRRKNLPDTNITSDADHSRYRPPTTSSGPDGMPPLRAALQGYTVDSVVEAIGEEGQSALGRNHTLAAQRALGGRDDTLATLTRLFILQDAVEESAVEHALPVDALLAAGVLVRDGDELHALVDLRPYGSPDDGADGWLVSDHAATLDTARGAPREDHVLGVSPASTTLAQMTIRRPVGRALDLGTGCGVQALHLAKHAQSIVATDLNPRALRLADLGLRLSGVSAELRLGSLYEPAGTDPYDLIITNPPFVMSPPSEAHLTYRESDFTADGLMRSVVTGAVDHLAPGGVLQVLGNWAHVAGEPWDERVGPIPGAAD